MIELIATIILFIGLIGIGVIVIRKIPVLAKLSLQGIEPGPLSKLKEKVKNNGALKVFSGKKTSTWPAKSRQRSLEKKSKFSDDFWGKLKRK